MMLRSLIRGFAVMAVALPTLWGSALAAGSASDVFKKPLTEASKPALQQSLSVLTASPLTMGDFKQTRTIKKMNREFVSTGSFAIDREAGIVWDTKKPFPSF